MIPSVTEGTRSLIGTSPVTLTIDCGCFKSGIFMDTSIYNTNPCLLCSHVLCNPLDYGGHRMEFTGLTRSLVVKMKLEIKTNLTFPVVWRLISANLWLNFILSFFVFCSKAFSRIIFSFIFQASNRKIVDKKIWTEFVF